METLKFDPKTGFIALLKNITTVKFDAADSPHGQRRFATRGQFGYDQFANWTFDDCKSKNSLKRFLQLLW